MVNLKSLEEAAKQMAQTVIRIVAEKKRKDKDKGRVGLVSAMLDIYALGLDMTLKGFGDIVLEMSFLGGMHLTAAKDTRPGSVEVNTALLICSICKAEFKVKSPP